MKTVGIREFRNRATEIVRDVRENGEAYRITVGGRRAARLVPDDEPEETKEERAQAWAEWFAALDEFSQELSAAWPKGVSAVEAVAEQRRKAIYGDA